VPTFIRSRSFGLTLAILRAALFLALALETPLALGQSTNASVSGRVTDRTNAVIPDTELEIKNVDTGVTYTTKTNGDGFYSFPDLRPGNYLMNVRKPQFETVSVTGITLHVQDSLSRNFVLQVGSSAVSVTVRADQNNINTTDATVKTTVDRNFAENMPMNGRSFHTLITLTPGVVLTDSSVSSNAGQFSVNGQRADANYFMIDGVGANFGVVPSTSPAQSVGGTLPAFTALGGTNSLVPVDALQEFTIQTSTYGAEYGRTPGGQISIETRSGTNAYHGSAFDYFRNDVLDANNWFNDHTIDPNTGKPIPKAPERQNDFGGTFGGPVIKDHTFFFASYEGLRLRQPSTYETDVPSLALRSAAALGLQPILNSFPVPNGPDYVDSSGTPTGAAPFTESISNPSSIDTGTFRVDQVVGKRLLLFGRYSDSYSAQGSVYSNGLTVTDARVRTLTVGANWNVNNSLTNSIRFNYSSDILAQPFSLVAIGGGKLFDTSILFPSYVSPADGQGIAGFSVGNSYFYVQVGSALHTVQRQWNFLDTSTYVIGNHALKFGIDYRRLTPDFRPRSYVANAYFPSEDSVLTGILPYLYVTAQTEVRPRFMNLSLYLEDTWKLSPRLTLNYGLRYDLNPVASEAHGIEPLNVIGLDNPPTATLASSGTSLYSTRYDNFAPRLGVAYQVSQSPQFVTVLRAGFGKFYDLGVDSAASGYDSIPFVFRGQFPQVPYPSSDLPGPPTFTLNPPFNKIYGIDPRLMLPYTLQWNATVEQALGSNQSVSVGYVAAAGRNLLRQDNLYNFNPEFRTVYAIRNAATSSYNSLQIQFKRRLTNGVQVLAAYTYAHSIDDASNGVDASDSSSTFLNPNFDRGSSDFDVRHNFTSAVSYDIPKPSTGALGKAVFGGWSVDAIGTARTALPVNLVGGFSDDGSAQVRPDVIPDQPWYISGPYPGGRSVNPGAFEPVPTDANGGALRQGNLGRNAVRGLGAWQVDFALRRKFDLGERWKIEFRSEFFNVFNHPNFGNIDNFVGDGRFGQAQNMLSQSYGDTGLSSLYQIGGPRSIQFALKLTF
jgi:hypothetical protein